MLYITHGRSQGGWLGFRLPPLPKFLLALVLILYLFTFTRLFSYSMENVFFYCYYNLFVLRIRIYHMCIYDYYMLSDLLSVVWVPDTYIVYDISTLCIISDLKIAAFLKWSKILYNIISKLKKLTSLLLAYEGHAYKL
jgi:hypothetical protein